MPLGRDERQGECDRHAHEVECYQQAAAIGDASERGGPGTDRDIGDHLDRERGAEHGGGARAGEVMRGQRQRDGREPRAEQGDDLRQQQAAIDRMSEDGEHDKDASRGTKRTHGTCLPAPLIAAYRAAWYRIALPDGDEIVRIGAPAPRTQAWLRGHGAAGAAFVTACNPHGQRRDDDANAAALARLRAHVRARGWTFLEGAGGDDAGAWTPEPSLAVALDSMADAAALGRAFSQNAVVWIPAEDAAMLLITREVTGCGRRPEGR